MESLRDAMVALRDAFADGLRGEADAPGRLVRALREACQAWEWACDAKARGLALDGLAASDCRALVVEVRRLMQWSRGATASAAFDPVQACTLAEAACVLAEGAVGGR